jgi:hypothetical protein
MKTKLLKKIITSIKDPDPCKTCLVTPICSKDCDEKNKWTARINSLFVGFLIPIGIILIGVFYFCMGVVSIFFYFGLVDEAFVDKFNPFPIDEDYYDDYYY